MRFSELSILLVEPSATQIKIILRHLTQQGVLRIDGVHTGQEAMEFMGRYTPDLVISAMYLPDMTAVELVQMIRRQPRLEQVAFMLLSSETDFHTLEPIRQAGIVAILPKPFEPDDLRRALRSTIAYIEPDEISLEKFDIADLRVLLVDDSAMARKHISRVLNNLGVLRITTAVNGRKGADLFEQHLFDLVVTDLNMPEMDGQDLVRYIRNQMGNHHTPILMVTSEQDMYRLSQVEQDGVSAICDKPFELLNIKETIYRLLKPE